MMRCCMLLIVMGNLVQACEAEELPIPAGRRSFALNAGAEATWLKVTRGGEDFTGLGGATLDWHAAPRIWIGASQENGWGIRARYWDYHAGSSSGLFNYAYTPTARAYSAVAETLDAFTVDLELTREQPIWNWVFLGTLGARYADFEQHFHVSANSFNPMNAQVTLRDVVSDVGVRGTGPTIALQGRRPLWGGPLALVFGVRNSLLWGPTGGTLKNFGRSFAPDGMGGLDIVNIDADLGRADETNVFWIGEVQAGLEWRRPLNRLGGEVFLRGVFEVQRWCSDEARLMLTSGARDESHNLTFLGGAFAVGFER